MSMPTDPAVAALGTPEQEQQAKDSEILRRCNIVEIAVANNTGSVSDYMNHWEGRALKAEAALGTLEPLQPTAEALWESIGGELCICQRAEVWHWCEKCQGRIQLIREALEAARAAVRDPEQPIDPDGRFILNAYGRRCFELGRESAVRDTPQPQELRQVCASCGHYIETHHEDGCVGWVPANFAPPKCLCSGFMPLVTTGDTPPPQAQDGKER